MPRRHLDTSRDVTSRALLGGADDTAGKQVGLLKLISASVLVLTGRAEQKVVRWHREKCLRASGAKVQFERLKRPTVASTPGALRDM